MMASQLEQRPLERSLVIALMTDHDAPDASRLVVGILGG